MIAGHLDTGAVIDDDDFFVFAETVPHMVWMMNASGRLEYVNRRSVDYIGQRAADIGTSWLGLVHPDDAPATIETWNDTNSTGVPREAEMRLRRHDGLYRWHRFHALALRDTSGVPQRWIGVATDVDNEHRGQQRLLAMERTTAEALVLLETLQLNAPVGFGLLDLDLRIVRENATLAQLLGGTVAEQIGQLLREVIPDRWRTLEPVLTQVIKHREAVLDLESTARLASEPHRVHYVSCGYYPIVVECDLIGIGVVAADVTDRKEAEIAQRELTLAAVAAIAAAVEARDPYTAGHQRRVAAIAFLIALEMGLDHEEALAIKLAASIHDIGKLGIPAEILSCPRRLTAAEFELVKTHSRVGHDIVAGINFGAPVADMIVQHHERLDGTGYPDGLAGDQILLGARIIAVADTVEAMASHRPYRPTRGLDLALDEIRNGRGTLFDPKVADTCEQLLADNRLNIDELA